MRIEYVIYPQLETAQQRRSCHLATMEDTVLCIDIAS
jgi:hypothetical protein